MIRVVIDTNALINAADDDFSFPHRILDEVLAGSIEAYANSATLRENRMIVSGMIRDPGYLDKLQKYFERVRTVESSQRLSVVEDPEDNKILESAIAASAQFLITSDQHLLKLNPYESIAIVTPAEFWNRLEDEEGRGWQNWIKQFISSV
ncbi:MAG: putative toxin-antitoxin system toxin component, PIN family [Candidatus Doudnabacteria bacterium RIFCSPHIGHO2_01_FULL_50_11]|uniref:Putative toxin-antitoxin system toxin component, PIN family n=1 Tax=Candidatus Doudnabacteria bacterium RIFCSPHIGHO2_01_FULL_50_11 TaxID=1817828 RepID=A0A1F5PLR1_9BACT|nr:MAG: putative toxin-antitoxin system toxin component, PIN family [Candidatus Doudnabacteria bacterium RIFCSPHIGHO2_01_FULL_50_11]